MGIVDTFSGQVDDVTKLMNFDRDFMDIAIQSVTSLRDRLRNHHELDNPGLTADKTLEQLKGFRTHDSLRSRYETIFNQALVLLVSYFGSSMQDLFKMGVSAALVGSAQPRLLQEELRLTLQDICDLNFDLKEATPELLIRARDISFQDMQSIHRAFKNHLGIEIEKDRDVNNIILGQGCRHVIVHVGSLVSERLVKQVSNAVPRDVKPRIVPGEHVQFSEAEVNIIAISMKNYLRTVVNSVEGHFGINV